MLIIMAPRHSYKRKMHSGGLLQNFHKSLLIMYVYLSVYRWMIDTLMMYLSELHKEEQDLTYTWIFFILPFTGHMAPVL